MSAELFEKLLQGQVGVVFGILLACILFGAIGKFFAAKLIAKIEESTEAQDRMTRTVANLLLSSEIKALQERGREVIEEITQAQAQRQNK